MTRFIVFGLCSLLFLLFNRVLAAQCTDIFPDVLASHANGGNISLSSGVGINNPDNILQTSTLTGGISSCNGQNCSASGVPATTLDIPFRTAACNVRFCNFQMFGTTSLGLRGNSFGNISSRHSFGRITRASFSENHNEYFFNSLRLLNNDEITLNSGQTYYINNLSLGNNVKFFVRSSFRSGPARIILGNSVNFPQNVLFNSPSLTQSGDVTKLLIYGHGSVGLGNNNAFSGILYSRGFLSAGNNSRLNGVVSAQNMSLAGGVQASYNANVFNSGISDLCDLPVPPQLIAHYQFEQNTWTGANSVIDSSSNTNNGSPRGVSPNRIVSPQSPTPAIPVASGSCQVMDVPQNNDNLEVALNSNIDLDQKVGSKGTISFWYKADQAWQSSTQRTLFDASIGDGSNNLRDAVFFLEIQGNNSGRLRFVTEDTNDRSFEFTSQQGFNFSANTWVHIALSWDLANRAVTLRVNGAERVMNGTIESGFNSVIGNLGFLHIGDNASFNFGFGSTANSAAGQFDDVRVYNFVQTTAQVQADRSNVTPCPITVDHYRINHSGQGLTCEPLPIQIRACQDATCSRIANVASAITLSPTGFSGANVNSNTVTFSGSETTASTIQLARTTAGNITLSSTNANPTAPLRCFIGGLNSTNENCNVTFTDTGLLLGAMSRQTAESVFTGVTLRAVQRVAGNPNACGAALSGSQTVAVSYNCTSPNECKTALQVGNATVNGAGRTGATSANIVMNFNSSGEATVPNIRFADAGRINLSAAINVNNVNLTSNSVDVDVVPARLAISAPNFPATPIAGQNFQLRLAALGANGRELPNYLPANIQTQEKLVQPVGGSVGDLSAYASSLSLTSNGVYQDNTATYSETGSVELVVVDSNYLGTYRLSSNTLTLSDFVPSYYNVSLVNNPPSFVNTNSTFTYIGQPFRFSQASANTLTYRVQALNQNGAVTNNYDNSTWRWDKAAQIPSTFQLTEQSGYMPNNLVIFGTPTEQQASADIANLDGDRVVTLNNLQVRHTKSATPVTPFSTNVNLAISPSYFTDTVSGHTLCYRDRASSACRGLTINNISGADMRYGRLQLLSNQSDENQALFLPLQVEYFDSSSNYVVNSDDSQTMVSLTSSDINVSATANSALVTAINRNTPQVNGRSSNGRVSGLAGVSLGASGIIGEALVNLMLDSPSNIGTWRYFLNTDRDNDGDIDRNDQPQATATFGRFRGNDRIILWREQL